MGRKFLWHITVNINGYFNHSSPESLLMKLIAHLLHIVSKLLRTSQIKMGVHDLWCILQFLLYLSQSKTTFLKIFISKRPIQRHVTRLALPFEFPSTLKGFERSSDFAYTDIFLKNVECLFLFTFRYKVYISRYLIGSIFLLHPVHFYFFFPQTIHTFECFGIPCRYESTRLSYGSLWDSRQLPH